MLFVSNFLTTQMLTETQNNAVQLADMSEELMSSDFIQQNPEEHLEYRLVSESGPDHDKLFTVEVCLNSNVIGSGTGRSKKQAEQLAAKEAIALMGELNAI